MAEGPHIQNDLTITFRPVKDNIYVVSKTGQKTSGYLISRFGKLYEYNSESEAGEGKYNSETKASFSQSHIDRMRNSADPAHRVNPHVLNEFTFEFPEYLPDRRVPGAIAAYVQAEDGSAWAHYQYVGLSNYHGVKVAVFDLLRDVAGKQVTVGFDLVDIRTAMPIYLDFQSGSRVNLEQISCH